MHESEISFTSVESWAESLKPSSKKGIKNKRIISFT
jgi:hypothetical protein